ncbi:hypothetical protein KAR91_07355 [Candidatus Pacearchaeota archaeon]|nr:hypothetical protein [Candidatus Pacearchaeota archaeon]
MWLVSRLLLFLFLVTSAVAQQTGTLKKLEMRGPWRLNTVTSDPNMKLGDLRIAHNIDFGANLGAMTIRFGYDSISTISGMDSILGIYGAYYSDGTQQLFVVADSSGVGYGNIYVANKGSVNLTADSLTRIWQYWGIQNHPSFTMQDDNVYIVNGQQKGIVWNGTVARTWPPRVPGEPLIVPLNDTASTGYGLDGTYRYVLTTDSLPSGSSFRDVRTYLSSPVTVKNGKVLITGLMWPRDDSLTSLDTSTTSDTVRYILYRTKGDIGRLDRTDSVYADSSTHTRVANFGALADLVIIDSTSDDSLGAARHIFPDSLLGRDSTGTLRSYLGSPGYVSMDTTIGGYNTNRDTLGDSSGIFYGLPTQKDTLGVAYTCTFIDTNTAIESDTGRSLFVWNTEGENAYSVTIKLPRIPSGDSGLVINLYRAHILQVTFDSSYWDTVYTGTSGPVGYYNVRWVSYLMVDTVVVGSYSLQGQYVSSDTQVIDSIRFDSLSTRREFTKTSPPSLTSDVFSWDNRLWSIETQKVWNSQITNNPTDTLQSWMQASPIPINPDDGDQITLAYPSSRGVIRVFKNFSNYNIFQNSSLEWARTEVSGTFGCIAPNSYARGFSGHYYLSDAGVVRETEGPNLERTQSTELVSAPIKSFDNMSLLDKSKAIGFYNDRKYMLHVPAAGTTYVYDERANAWSTWDLVFEGATKYDIEDEIGFLPGATMYYFNDSSLYRIGSEAAFNNDVINDPVIARWETGPLFLDGNRQSVEKIGLWAIQHSSTRYRVAIAITDEGNSISDSITFITNVPLLLYDRYKVKSVGSNSGVFLLLGGTNRAATFVSSVPPIIDGIDIWYTEQGEVLVE